MLGFLRFVGLLNAGIWLGGVVFYTLGADPAFFSKDMEHLIGLNNYPRFSGLIAQLVAGRYFHLQLICGMVALLHLLAEWLYFGKSPRRLWLGLLIVLIVLSLISGCWLAPKLNALSATRSAFHTWHTVSKALNLLLAGGLGLYLWRVANPPESTRFVSAATFRS